MTIPQHIDFEVPGFGEFASPPVVQPGYADAVLAAGPVAYWRLGETAGSTATDATANAIDGTYFGGVQLGAAGLLEFADVGSPRFNGADAYVDIPSHPLVNSAGPYSVKTCTAWFDADTTQPRQLIYEQGGRNRGMAIYLDAGDLYVGLWQTGGNAYVSTPIAGGVHMAALVYGRTPGLVEGYLDGALFDQATSAATIASHDNRTGVGAVAGQMRFHDGVEPVTLDAPFAGRIGDVAVFNAALDAAAIASLYRTGVGR